MLGNVWGTSSPYHADYRGPRRGSAWLSDADLSRRVCGEVRSATERETTARPYGAITTSRRPTASMASGGAADRNLTLSNTQPPGVPAQRQDRPPSALDQLPRNAGVEHELSAVFVTAVSKQRVVERARHLGQSGAMAARRSRRRPGSGSIHRGTPTDPGRHFAIAERVAYRKVHRVGPRRHGLVVREQHAQVNSSVRKDESRSNAESRASTRQRYVDGHAVHRREGPDPRRHRSSESQPASKRRKSSESSTRMADRCAASRDASNSEQISCQRCPGSLCQMVRQSDRHRSVSTRFGASAQSPALPSLR